MWRILKLDEVASTNTYAREGLAEGSLGHGDVIQAAHQTAGRGRLAGRVWKDQPHQSLLMSVVLRDLPPIKIELVAYLIVLAVAHAIRQYVPPARVCIKWPNDLLIQGRKVCGILAEGVWQGDRLKGLIIGIGVNVSQTSFSPELNIGATSLLLEGASPTIDEVRNTILSSLHEALETCKSMPPELWTQNTMAVLDREFEWMQQLPPFDVELDGAVELHDMTFAGITDTGFLLLRHTDGTIETLNAGSLRFRLPQF